MSLEELDKESVNLEAERLKLKGMQKKVKEAMDLKFMVAKFDNMTDSEKEAMKIYVNGFSSEVNTGNPGG